MHVRDLRSRFNRLQNVTNPSRIERIFFLVVEQELSADVPIFEIIEQMLFRKIVNIYRPLSQYNVAI